MTSHYCTDERYRVISETYNNYGEVKAAEILGMTVHSLQARIREAKRKGIFIQSTNNMQSKDSTEYFSFVNASNDIDGLKYRVESFDVKLIAFSFLF